MSTTDAARLARLGLAGPDEMGRELAEGPAAVETTLAGMERLAPQLAAARAAARRTVLLGTGASLAMARTAEPILRVASAAGAGGPVVVRESSQAVLGAPDGDVFAATDLVVAISQSGSSPETLAAAREARAAGACLFAVTAGATSALASAADVVIHTPSGPEEGAATKSELAALAALLAVAGALPCDPAARAGLRATLEAIVGDPGGAIPAGLALGRANRAWAVGFGTALGLAHAMATLLHEKALLAAVASTPSEFRHGPIEAATPDDIVLLIETDRPDRRRTGYLQRLVGELARIGTPLVVAGAMPGPAGTIGLPTGDAGGAATPGPAVLLATLLRLQQAARVAAHARGTYRDGFRILREVVRAGEELAAEEPRPAARRGATSVSVHAPRRTRA